jgi:hypothetical protein
MKKIIVFILILLASPALACDSIMSCYQECNDKCDIRVEQCENACRFAATWTDVTFEECMKSFNSDLRRCYTDCNPTPPPGYGLKKRSD